MGSGLYCNYFSMNSEKTFYLLLLKLNQSTAKVGAQTDDGMLWLHTTETLLLEDF